MSQHFYYPPNSASIAGSITADQGSPNTDANAWPVKVTDGIDELVVNADGSINVAITGGLSNPLPVQDSAAEASLASIDAKLTNPLPVSGPLTDAELRASAVPISAASLPLPTGAATSANQVTANASLSSIDSKLTSPLAVIGPLTDTELRATPVPISGTVSTNGLTDAELRASPVDISASSLPLPSGAATSANQVTANASLSSIDSKLTAPLSVTGPLTDVQLRATPVPVSGTISTNGLTDAELRASPVDISASSLPLPTGAATSANQVTANASLSSIDSKLTAPLAVTGPLTDTELRASAVPVSAASLPLPTGAATAANQATANASLSSIDSKLTAPLSVTGPLTDAELRATAVPVSMASAPLPTGAATEATLSSFSDKSGSADVVEAYDYRSISYVGATERIDTIVYKSGGAGGTTVATQTFGYDGSNRLTSITKT